MKNWRDPIIKSLRTETDKVTVVSDPDGLLLDEKILSELRRNSIELLSYEDEMSFRFIFESRFRSKWDNGQDLGFTILIRISDLDISQLPYDLLLVSRKLSFDLASLFPDLAYKIVSLLSKSDLDSLFTACVKYNPGKLSVNGTLDFILRHVFQIAPELITSPANLLVFLLRKHYLNRSIPQELESHLINGLKKNETLADWPLEEITPNRNSFFEFLQERWPIFLDQELKLDPSLPQSEKIMHRLRYEGPVYLPFGNHDVKIYIDNMFLEGLLEPIASPAPNRPIPEWISVGVKNAESSSSIFKIKRLLDNTEDAIPTVDSRAVEWLTFAYKWAELSLMRHSQAVTIPSDLQDRTLIVQDKLDNCFVEWLSSRYAGLSAQPPTPPFMVSHIPRFLQRRVEHEPGGKVVFVLVDGLALEQWFVIREVLRKRCPGLRFEEKAVFAWAPTLTSISRQSAFSGKIPMFFPTSLYSSEKDATHWNSFWTDHGLKPIEIAFHKLGSVNELSDIKSLFDSPETRIIGVILTQIDTIMHGMCLGAAGMIDQARVWAETKQLARIIDCALERDYSVYISSDHGNIESHGIGRPAEGVEAELKGQRVRIFDNINSREKVRKLFPNTIEWPPIGLPENCLPLFAGGRTAFGQKGESIVTHGGLSIEEIIVPFINVESN